MIRVKGTKITSKLTFVTGAYGDGAVKRVLASMSPEDREVVPFVLDVGWYPQDLYERLLVAICRELAGGDADVYARIGRHAADHQLTHAYRAYRAAELRGTLANMVRIHAKLNDPNAMDVAFPGPGRATLVVSQPPSTLVLCSMARAFYQRAVELHGVDDVAVDEVECSARGDARCRFELSWTPPAA